LNILQFLTNSELNTIFPEDKGTKILRNYGNYSPVDKTGK